MYVTRALRLGGGRQWNSITNIGYRPTFGASDELSIETFLLDAFEREHARPHPRGVPVARARGTQIRFSAALKEQILRDVRVAQRYFRRTRAWIAA